MWHFNLKLIVGVNVSDTGAPGDITKTCSFRPTLCGAAPAEREPLLADQETKATKWTPLRINQMCQI